MVWIGLLGVIVNRGARGNSEFGILYMKQVDVKLFFDLRSLLISSFLLFIQMSKLVVIYLFQQLYERKNEQLGLQCYFSPVLF